MPSVSALSLLTLAATSILAGHLAAAELVDASEAYLASRAEIEAMERTRDMRLYELDVAAIGMGRVLVPSRTGIDQPYHYLVFRLRNRVSDDARYLQEHATRFNEVMAAIVNEFAGVRLDTSEGPRLVVDEAGNVDDPTLADIVSRAELAPRARRVNITAICEDENGTRFDLFDDQVGEGFTFADMGQTRYGMVFERVRDLVEEKLGRRLRSVHELRGMELPPYDANRLTEEGEAIGEVHGVLIFERLPVEGDLFTIQIQGLSNKLRIQTPSHQPDQIADYVNTEVLRRTYVVRYARPGDEFYLDLAEFRPLSAGWEWRPAFTRLRLRRAAAYATYFLENVEQVARDGEINRNEEVEQAFWRYFDFELQAMQQRHQQRLEALAAERERVASYYDGLIEESPISAEQLRQRRQEGLDAIDARRRQLEDWARTHLDEQAWGRFQAELTVED